MINKKIISLFILLLANFVYSQCNDNILEWVQIKEDPNRGGFGFNYGNNPNVESMDDAGGITIATANFSSSYSTYSVTTNKLEFELSFNDYNDSVTTELWVNGVKYMDMVVPADNGSFEDFDNVTVYAPVKSYNGATVNGLATINIPESKLNGPATNTNFEKAHIVLTFPSAITLSSGSIQIRNVYPYLAETTGWRSQGDYEYWISLKACPDSDNDGITDEIDLDDDNDGILDAEESPECFYNVFEANRIAKVVSSFNGAGSDPVAGNDIALLYNDNNNDGTTSTAFNFASSQNIAPSTSIFTVQYPTSLVLESLTVIQATNGIMASGRYGRLYGSNDGFTYDVISSSSQLNSANVIFTNTTNNSYKYYQIRYIGTSTSGNSTISALGTTAIHEITSLVSTTVPYTASAHPKPGSCSFDTDGDGIPNHLDLDSDGDGCPDAIEGGGNFTSSDLTAASGDLASQTPNQNFGVAVDTNGIPIVVGPTGQTIGYSQIDYLTECLDSDGDGIPDVCDLDDDNDGILDINESAGCTLDNTTMRIGYIPNSRDTDTDNGYTFDGQYMMNSGALKLTNPANFGPSGTVKTTIQLVPINGIVTKQAIENANINVLFLGGIDNLPTSTSVSYLSSAEFDAIKDWSLKSRKNIVVATQIQTQPFGATITSGGTDPNTLTPLGAATAIFNGPFGAFTTFNQGGNYRAYFSNLPDICTTQSLAVDNSGRPVIYYDGIYFDYMISDVDIFTTYGGVTNNATITSNNDKLFANFWAFLAQQALCDYTDTDGDGIPNHLDLDSDNDGCLDALEGGHSITNSQLVNAGGILSVGIGSSALNQNLCNNATCVDQYGVPLIVGNGGQGIGTSQDSTEQSGCEIVGSCTKPPRLGTPDGYTKVGITIQQKQDAWPGNIPNGHIALESNTKGLVITRVANQNAITNPKEGMLIYDIAAACVKLYNGIVWNCIKKSCDSTVEAPRKIRIGRFASYTIGSTQFPAFNSQLLNTANYGFSGTFSGITGFEFSDITSALSGSSGSQLKGNFDIVNTGYSTITAVQAKNVADFVKEGGVAIINLDNTSYNYNPILVAFGITGSNSTGAISALSSSINELSNVFGNTKGINLSGANTQGRVLASQLPAGSIIYASETNAGGGAAVWTIRGEYKGRVIFVWDEGIFRDASVSGNDINTPQEKFIHNIMAYALGKLGFQP